MAGAGFARDDGFAFGLGAGLAILGFGDGAGDLATGFGGSGSFGFLDGAGVLASGFGGGEALDGAVGILGDAAGGDTAGCFKDKGASTSETVCVFHASSVGAPHHQLLAATPNPASA
ncbi:MAG: hypothetical protein ETSY2_28800 [Candidatus Entotheonella gemina]|uniref:Uncharacterized protein n=1 Tax=Candidatus Entotheonella gemina TaxID=1429439 RepID=W4M271_9BACT|nr:MAG: hypothetical protein ETSY2_28800 [Candidatus Entotheonella gemina]